MQRVDRYKAASAYERLIVDSMGLKSGRIAFATTNYDNSLELALREHGVRVADGFPEDPLTEQVMDPGLLSGMEWDGPSVPVLHLHGAVGWYRKPGGEIVRYQTGDQYMSSLGVPALLLPDNTKSTTSLVGGETLWEKFQELVHTATRIVFVGHSLHDGHLIGCLAGTTAEITVLQYDPDGLSGDSERWAEESRRVRGLLGMPCEVVPYDFRPREIGEGPAVRGELGFLLED
jgi:hypothetical protein